MPSFKPNQSTNMKKVDFCIIGLTISIIMIAATTVLFFIISPNTPGLPGNVLPTNSWLLFPLIYVFPIYTVIYCYITIGIVTVSAFILGTVYIPLLVRELPVGKHDHKYSANENLRSPSNIIHVFMTVEILQTKINQLCGVLLLPFQTVITLLFAFSGYVVIRHRDKIGTVPFVLMVSWVTFAPAVWGLLLVMGGYLHSNGLKILNSWKRHTWNSKAEKKLMNKFAKSCRPIMICHQKMFIIRKISVLLYVKSMSRNLVRTLLTLDKY